MNDISLDVVLARAVYRDMFYSFLQKQHNTDTFDFVVSYQNQSVTANELFDTFIRVNAKRELNISTLMRNQVLNVSQHQITAMAGSTLSVQVPLQITYSQLRPIMLQMKVDLNEGPYRQFRSTSQYKHMLTLHYDRQHTDRALSSKDVSEWNSIEVYLFLFWNNMDYILYMDKLLGKLDKVNGVELYLFIDNLRDDPDPDVIRHIPMIHFEKLLSLADGHFYDSLNGLNINTSTTTSSSSSSRSSSPSPGSAFASHNYLSRKTSSNSSSSFRSTTGACITMECHYNGRITALEISRDKLSSNNMLDEIVNMIANALDCSRSLLTQMKLVVTDDDGDRITMKSNSDVSYLFTQKHTIRAEFIDPLDF